VLSSSNAGALVNFGSGTKNVYCDYSGSTALSGGGGGVYPTVKPTLNLDFANSRTLDPRITFARATTATYYDGKTTAMAEQNLLLQSNTFSNAAWSKPGITITANATVAPDGTSTGQTVTESALIETHRLFESASFTSGLPYTFSQFIKYIGRQYVQVNFSSVTTGVRVIFDIQNGLVTDLLAGGTAPTSASIVSYGNGWYRLSVTVTPTAEGSITVPLGGNSTSTGNGQTYTGSGADAFYIWGAQLEQRSSATAYTPTTTAAITNYIPVLMTAPAGVPRLDYNPTTGQALGLLIEEQRTNLLTYSSDFSNAVWSATGLTVTSAATIAPDGSLTGSTLSVLAGGFIRQLQSAIAGNNYTTSIWVKKSSTGSATNIRLTTNNTIAWNTGISQQFALTTTWQRIVLSGIAISSGNTAYIIVGGLDAANGTDSTCIGNVDIWGAQLEAGAFATSYIPTTSAQVTRNADNCSASNLQNASWYNIAQGTWHCEVNLLTRNQGNGGSLLGTWDSNSTNQHMYVNPTGNGLWQISSINTTSLGLQKCNYSYVVGNNSINSFSSNGVVGISYYYANPSVGAINLRIGSSYSQGLLDGHIRKIAYYPQALSSQNLVALTS
jgi:hypothetical protein